MMTYVFLIKLFRYLQNLSILLKSGRLSHLGKLPNYADAIFLLRPSENVRRVLEKFSLFPPIFVLNIMNESK